MAVNNMRAPRCSIPGMFAPIAVDRLRGSRIGLKSPNGAEGAFFLQIKSRMVCVDPQVGEEEWFSAGLATSAIGLNRHENGVDLCQHVGIVELQHPALFGRVVLKKDA